MIQKVNADNLCEIADRLADTFKEHQNIPQVHTILEDLLDDLLARDFFGTEGQSDPRGDRRDED